MIVNQRGVYFVDPEGKPELELAEEYRNRANVAEEKGYSRYASVLNKIAKEYAREARQNIALALKQDAFNQNPELGGECSYYEGA